MTPRQFMEEVYEIAYGDQAYYRGFFPEEVLETLREFSDNALKVEELSLEPEQYEDMDRQLEESYRRGYMDGRKFALQQQESRNSTPLQQSKSMNTQRQFSLKTSLMHMSRHLRHQKTQRTIGNLLLTLTMMTTTLTTFH